MLVDSMSHVCYEGSCASGTKQRNFSSIRGLRQHQYRCHQDTPEEDMSLGNSRSLKRKRDTEDKEEQQKRNLEAQVALEAASREPELQPVRSTDCVNGTGSGLTSFRFHCLNAPLTLGFSVRRDTGSSLLASGTPYHH
jgi:hypothetical protein